MIDKSKVLVITNHCRRLPFFDATLKRIIADGYKNVIIQNTGGGGPLATIDPELYGSCAVYNIGHTSYDNGMLHFKTKHIAPGNDFEYILYIDNDLYLSSVQHLERYLSEFDRDRYDYACHFISSDMYNDLEYDLNCIAEVKSVDFIDTDIYPGFIPSPHWENSYMIIKKSLWDNLSEDAIFHGRKWIKEMHKLGAKLGAHKANYRGKYSHFGNQWFHIGNFMNYFGAIETNNLTVFKEDDTIAMSRLGLLMKQYQMFGWRVYPAEFNNTFMKLWDEYCRPAEESFNKLVRDTCIEELR
jgi:hypothetical protein